MRTLRHHRTLTIAALIGGAVAVIGGWAALTDQNDSLESPLSAYIGFDRLDLEFGTPDTVEARMAAAEADRQATIATCMKAEGFDYQPTATATEADNGDDPVTDPTSRAYAETYGFGITTLAFSQDQVGQHLTGYTPTNNDPDPADPNLDTINDLDPDQRAAYLEAGTAAVFPDRGFVMP